MLSPRILVLLFSVMGSIWAKLQKTNESDRSLPTQDVKPIEKRYSEAILASDYSKYVDTMMTKNFVDWLIAAKQTSTNSETTEGIKRDLNVAPTTARPPHPDLQSAKNFQNCVLKHQGKKGCTRTMDATYSFLRDQLIHELLDRLQVATKSTSQRRAAQRSALTGHETGNGPRDPSDVITSLKLTNHKNAFTDIS